jgi:sugar phosphate permease
MVDDAPPRSRWVVLGAGVAGMTAGSAFLYGLPSLLPLLRSEGFSLSRAGLLVAAPTLGLLCTLVIWGALADRYGERWVISSGLGMAGLALLAVATVPLSLTALLIPLALGGAGAASVVAASGRLVLGWFAVTERGLAMGIRQTAQPLGVALAAATLPSLGARGHAPPFLFLAACCLGSAVIIAVTVRDPPLRPAAGTSVTETKGPYRGSTLWRLHGSAALLVVAQFAVATFGLVYLVEVHGWGAAAAGRLMAIAACGGALGRLGAGWWSDRVGSRIGPFRLLAVAVAVVMAALALAGPAGPVVLIVAGIVSVSTNGLSNLAVAEHAGAAWAGRSLALHNTGQNIVAAAVPPVLGLLVGATGYPQAFLLAGGCAALAGVVIPQGGCGLAPTIRH